MKRYPAQLQLIVTKISFQILLKNLRRRTHNFSNWLVLCLANFLVSIAIISVRYAYYPVIQGFDTTRYYMYSTNWFLKNPLYALEQKSLLRPGLFLILGTIKFLLAIPTDYLFFYLPYFLLFAYNFSVYFFIAPYSKKIAKQAFLFAPLTYFIVRISYDMIGNFIGLIVIYFFLGYYTRLLSMEVNFRKFILFLSLCFVFITFYLWLFEIALVLVFLHLFFLIIWNYLSGIKKLKFTIKSALMISISTFVIVLVFLFLLINYDARWIFRTYLFFFSDQVFGDLWYILNESSIALILTVIGVFSSIKRRKHHIIYLLYIWCIITFMLLLIGFEYPYRIYSIMPVSVFITFGADYIIVRLSRLIIKIKGINSFRKLLLSLCYVLIFLLLFSSILRISFIPSYVYAPDEVAREQIIWLREHFGFSNERVVILVFNSPALPLTEKSTAHIEGWCFGYLGDSVYFGSLLSLLSYSPDKYGRVVDYKNKTIILADKLYHITEIDFKFVKKLNHNGIYEVVNITLRKYLEYLLSYRFILNSTFFSFFKILKISFGINCIVGNNSINMSLILSDKKLRIVFDISNIMKIVNGTFKPSFLALKISGDYEKVLMSMKLLDDTYTRVGYLRQIFRDRICGNFWVIVPIDVKNDITAEIYYLELSFQKLYPEDSTLYFLNLNISELLFV